MKRITILAGLLTLVVVSGARADMEDDPVLGSFMLDKLEWQDADADDVWAWDLDAWIGRDLNKIWLKSEGEYTETATETAFTELLYSRAFSTYWDLQAGWRRDYDPQPQRDWFALALKGLAPFFFDIDASVYMGGNGTVAGQLNVAYEILFTQRLILSPELELEAYGDSDPDRGIGSGVSQLELGLRLRYEIRRELAPYLGLQWGKALGNTADLAEQAGARTSDVRLVAGVRAWY